MPPRSPSTSARLIRWRLLVAGYIIACGLVDGLPSYGPPFFRYTGSDPSLRVWNLGWPLALGIFDPMSGLHLGPFLYVILPVQAMVAVFIGIVIALWNRHNPAASGNGASPLLSHVGRPRRAVPE